MNIFYGLDVKKILYISALEEETKANKQGD